MFDPSLPLWLFYFMLFASHCIVAEIEFCSKSDQHGEDAEKCSNVQSRFTRNRYILYDVNSPEGFNLRRDVYIRAAVFVKDLAEKDDEFKWQLVLPPWGNLYHWQSKNIGTQALLPWGLFFDVASLQKYAPVIEMYKFIEEYPSELKKTELDIVYVLQNDEEMFKTGKFEDKNIVADCPQNFVRYYKTEPNKYTGYFWGYRNITARIVKCITFHGTMSDIKKNLNPSLYRSVMFDHMEIPLHDFYGSQEYWKARRSMRYNSELYDIANKFREKYLNSTNKADHTERPDDWTKEEPRRNAIGGPYLSVHWRRRDFIVGRSNTIPAIRTAASQLRKKMKELGLNLLFIATDATEEEFLELKEHLLGYTVLRFVPSPYVLNKYKDGGVAIIDQIICSYARYFIGTHESTFTFRIQEEREIIGFDSDTTFNLLCKRKETCVQTGRWEIVW